VIRSLCEQYRDCMTLFGWPVGWAVILMLPILMPLVWWDERVTQPRYARKMAAKAEREAGQ
jgi:ABC-type bacteriocin/lantibiotic exporter with double-glycine peptidase domain